MTETSESAIQAPAQALESAAATDSTATDSAQRIPVADDGDQPPIEAKAAEAPVVDAPVARPANTGDRRPSHGGPTTMPRAMAKAEIFVEGDYVVYPTHGVGKVERIATE